MREPVSLQTIVFILRVSLCVHGSPVKVGATKMLIVIDVYLEILTVSTKMVGWDILKVLPAIRVSHASSRL